MSALAPFYLLFKGLHVAFMVTWFAGLFYLPRLFIYHNDARDTISRERFIVMERRLFIIMTIGAVLTTMLGLLLLSINPGLLDATWMRLKLLLLVGLFIYHYRCLVWMTRLRADGVASSKWLRWFNEIPVIFLLGIILLAVTKAM
ncbi:MAG: TIGR00701 family protein [Woeseiaceae bacterium]|nr:TIGR00701 family protein [Woeseiaceae bacterium]